VRTGDRATTNTTSRPGRIARFAALIGLLAACSLPASAAAAEPTPSEAAERWFSATAEVARPKLEYL